MLEISTKWALNDIICNMQAHELAERARLRKRKINSISKPSAVSDATAGPAPPVKKHKVNAVLCYGVLCTPKVVGMTLHKTVDTAQHTLTHAPKCAPLPACIPVYKDQVSCQPCILHLASTQHEIVITCRTSMQLAS